MPVTATDALVIPRVAGQQALVLKTKQAIVCRELESPMEDFPLSGVLMSIPGIDIKTRWGTHSLPHTPTTGTGRTTRKPLKTHGPKTHPTSS